MNPAAATLAGFLRKLRLKGVKGVWEFAACRTFPIRERMLETYLEWHLGIDTKGEIDPVALGHRDPCANGYMPTFYASNLTILSVLPISPDTDVFVDFGSGKGRVVILAARFPFKRVVGIEFSPVLHEIALRNLATARNALRCKNVELVSGDAGEYAVPDDANVFYLANPFTGETLERVLGNIYASLRRAPRAITVISHGHSPEQPFTAQVRACPWLRLQAEVRLQCWTSAWIYRAGI